MPVGDRADRRRVGDLARSPPPCATPRSRDVSDRSTAQRVDLFGKTPGATIVTITDARGLHARRAVRVAYYAGSIASQTHALDHRRSRLGRVRPRAGRRARSETRGAGAARRADRRLRRRRAVHRDARARSRRIVRRSGAGSGQRTISKWTARRTSNVRERRRSAHLARLAHGQRLSRASDGKRHALHAPISRRDSRRAFSYFHYNPPGQPDRRIVLRAENRSPEPAIVQFISGRGGPSPNEMEVGHAATKRFLVNVVQNQGRLLTIPGQHVDQISSSKSCRPGTIVCNLLQLRVLSGGSVHLTLLRAGRGASDAGAARRRRRCSKPSTSTRAASTRFPSSTSRRSGTSTTTISSCRSDSMPLPNDLQGQALAGDYGVLQSFVVNVQNPLSTPQAIAIYENPRGGRADRHVPDRRRAGAVASSAAVLALQGPPIRRAGTRLRARDDRHDARGRFELSAAPGLRARRRQRRAGRTRLADLLAERAARYKRASRAR